MRILIDTNILIQLEDSRIISKDFSSFYNLAISNGCKILYHPEAIPQDIKRDNNLERKKIILSKLEKYETMENWATPSEYFLKSVKNSKINDKIDNRQLFQIYKKYVDLFVTQDKGIHTKATKFNLQEYVLSVTDAFDFLSKKFTIKVPQHPILQAHSIRNLESFFASSFFDSFRLDYGGELFDKWLTKCVQENRKCYSLIVENKLQAILIYNIEGVEQHQIPNIYSNILKICTLKVSNDAFGIKLGELFLNKMFTYCIDNSIKNLYLTVYEKQIELIKLLEKFGFAQEIFTNKQGLPEIRMLKCLDKGKISTKNTIITHPFYSDSSAIGKFAVPIQPQFYSTLFKDGKLRTPTLFDTALDSINEIHGNTIVKAYISNTRIKTLKQGDLLLFYSSKTNKSIEPIGILDKVIIATNFEQLWTVVRKKTVFSQEELKEILRQKKQLHVMIFRLITYMSNKIKLSRIKKTDSFKNNIQTVTRITEKDYIKLKDEGYFDKRYIID